MEEWSTTNRRQFIRQVGGLLALGTLANSPLRAWAKHEPRKLTVLHTNDWHSRIEPFGKDERNYAGLGGAEARAALIKKIRAEEKYVLLLDAGDVFQGTPYFNFYAGEPEYKLMTAMGYDCSTLGNHDFDNGIEGIVKQLPHAGFEFLNCNYNFNATPLQGNIKPYKVFNKGGIRVGIFGVGIELEGLVPKSLYGNIIYNDPITNANKTALLLKEEKKCDLVICLSHLGYQYKNNKVSDEVLAKQSQNIDLIIGGHTHTFLPQPVLFTNAQNKKVLVNQVGWAGINLGRIDFWFSEKNNQQLGHTASVNVIGPEHC